MYVVDIANILYYYTYPFQFRFLVSIKIQIILNTAWKMFSVFKSDCILTIIIKNIIFILMIHCTLFKQELWQRGWVVNKFNHQIYLIMLDKICLAIKYYKEKHPYILRLNLCIYFCILFVYKIKSSPSKGDK